MATQSQEKTPLIFSQHQSLDNLNQWFYNTTAFGYEHELFTIIEPNNFHYLKENCPSFRGENTVFDQNLNTNLLPHAEMVFYNALRKVFDEMIDVNINSNSIERYFRQCVKEDNYFLHGYKSVLRGSDTLPLVLNFDSSTGSVEGIGIMYFNYSVLVEGDTIPKLKSVLHFDLSYALYANTDSLLEQFKMLTKKQNNA